MATKELNKVDSVVNGPRVRDTDHEVLAVKVKIAELEAERKKVEEELGFRVSDALSETVKSYQDLENHRYNIEFRMTEANRQDLAGRRDAIGLALDGLRHQLEDRMLHAGHAIWQQAEAEHRPILEQIADSAAGLVQAMIHEQSFLQQVKRRAGGGPHRPIPVCERIYGLIGFARDIENLARNTLRGMNRVEVKRAKRAS